VHLWPGLNQNLKPNNMKPTFVLMLLFMWCYSNAYTVTIYGVDNCGYTTDLRNECSKNNIQFTYCNINETKCYNELVSIVSEFNLAVDNYVNLPVVLVVVDGKRYGFVRPSVVKIKELVVTTSVQMIGNSLYLPSNAEVFNLMGESITLPLHKKLDISSLVSGIYIVRYRENDKIRVKKIIKL
jgi:hypothetical protein